jgi:hypothetical protein
MQNSYSQMLAKEGRNKEVPHSASMECQLVSEREIFPGGDNLRRSLFCNFPPRLDTIHGLMACTLDNRCGVGTVKELADTRRK